MTEAVTIILKLLGVLLLVLLNGFFVAAEFAIVKIRDTQLQPLITKRHRRAKIARQVVANLDASLSATQLGITLASLGLGWFAEPVFASLLEAPMRWFGVVSETARHSISFAVGFSVITFLHIVAGELAPKSLAIQKPLPTTLFIAAPLLWFYKAAYPFIWGLNHASNWLLRRFGIEPVSEAELVHSEEELRLLFTTTQKHSGGTSVGRDLVLNAMDLRRRVAREVMRPRKEITAFDTEASIVECIDLAEKTRYSRYPLCQDGDLDKTLGVVHIKDLYAMRLRAKSGRDLRPWARKLIYVPETARLERLLQLFQDRKLHMAIVVDEYGGTVGLLTLENILEELVGQIQDEFDQEKPLLVQVGTDVWEADGALPAHQLAELIEEPIQQEGTATTSGFLTHRLGGFPKAGDVITLGNYHLKVEQMEGPRVARLLIQRLPPPAESDTAQILRGPG